MFYIEQIGETKNMLDFIEILTGEKICLMKSDFRKAVEKLKEWQENPTADNFTCRLFCLICKADFNNKKKFLKGFPDIMIVYLLWYYSKSQESFFAKWGNIQIQEPAGDDYEKQNVE